MRSPTCKWDLSLISLFDLSAEPKVYYFDMATCRLNQNIFKLDVSMYYVLFMHICQPCRDLSYNLLALLLMLGGTELHFS